MGVSDTAVLDGEAEEAAPLDPRAADPLDVDGAAVLVIVPVSGWLKSRAFISEPLATTLFGILFGGLARAWVLPTVDGDVLRVGTLEIARVTIGIQVLTSGMRVSRSKLEMSFTLSQDGMFCPSTSMPLWGVA